MGHNNPGFVNRKFSMSSEKNITVRAALREAMALEMRASDKVFLIGEEVGYYNGAYKVSQGLLAEFGEKRVIDTPITEYGFAGIGVGAAFNGLCPIVEFMTFNFAMQAIDHIINSAAKTSYMSGGNINCPIVFRGPNGAPRKVAAQHSQCYASWYAHCPGLKVVAPYNSFESYALLRSAIRDLNPVVFLEHEMLYGKEFNMPDSYENLTLPLDKAIVLTKGTDITLTSFSYGMDTTIKAADILKNEFNINAEVINLVSIRPIDIETIISSVKKTGRIINIEEGWPVCSIGSEVCSLIASEAFDYLDAPPMKICSQDVPMPYSPTLENAVLPSVECVVKLAKKLCNKGD